MLQTVNGAAMWNNKNNDNLELRWYLKCTSKTQSLKSEEEKQEWKKFVNSGQISFIITYFIFSLKY